MQKAERLLDLAAFLLRAAEPVSWREIQEQFPDDYGGSDEAAIRKFERDKAELVELGIPVRWVTGDEDLPAGYLIDRDEFYLPNLELAPEDLALLYVAGSAALAQGAFPYAKDLAHALNKLSFAARAPGASETAALAAGGPPPRGGGGGGAPGRRGAGGGRPPARPRHRHERGGARAARLVARGARGGGRAEGAPRSGARDPLRPRAEDARVSAAKKPREKAAPPPPRADPRDRLKRVLFLVPYAVKHPGIPVKELARKCGVSEKELLDDLDFLLGVGCPPFAPDDFLDLYVEGDRVYVALHQSFSRPPRFTESEAAALAAAAQALGGEGRDRAVKALRDSVPRDRRASYDELVGRIYAGSPPARDSVLGRLESAIADHREVQLRYFNASREEEGDRTVQPWTLAQRFGHWYLYAFDVTRERERTFRLDRIRECTVRQQRFD